MSRFAWGKIIDIFEYNFDGNKIEVVKYHPWVVEPSGRVDTGNVNKEEILFHIEALHESFKDIETAVIAWFVFNKLGNNSGALVYGIARAIGI